MKGGQSEGAANKADGGFGYAEKHSGISGILNLKHCVIFACICRRFPTPQRRRGSHDRPQKQTMAAQVGKHGNSYAGTHEMSAQASSGLYPYPACLPGFAQWRFRRNFESYSGASAFEFNELPFLCLMPIISCPATRGVKQNAPFHTDFT